MTIFRNREFFSAFYVVVGRLWGCKAGMVVCKDPRLKLLLEEVCASEELVSATSELLLRVIDVDVG